MENAKLLNGLPLNGFIDRYKDVMNNPEQKQLDFAKDVYNYMLTDTDTSKVTVLSGRCGIGKSMIAQSLVSYFLKDEVYNYRGKNSVGLVLITDKLDRLSIYQNEPQNSYLKDTSDNYRAKHKNLCVYITSDNEDISAQDLLIKSQYYPCVLLTTQRYFSMPDEQREMLFRYYMGKKDKDREKYVRRLVVFDEKPYFNATIPISIKNLNDCDTSLQDGISRGDPDKDWLLKEYRAFKNEISNVLRSKEEAQPTKPYDRFYWRDKNSTNMTSNDKRFFKLIKENKIGLTKVYNNALTDFNNFKKLMERGAFFITQKSKYQDYRTYFELYQDNKSLFYINQNKSKFFVLDGTCEYDPDFDLDYLKLVKFPKYNLPLDLTIYQYHVNSSKSYVVNSKERDKLITPIKNTICSHINDNNEMFVLTYQKIKEKFKDTGIQVNHFGGVKGLNDYIKLQYMSHVGLNRFDDFEYFIRYVSKRPDVLQILSKLDEDGSRKYIEAALKQKNGMFELEELNDIMFKILLADFEQNIFRTAIRNYNNEKPVFIYTYWNCEIYSKQNELIKQRFVPQGAKIKYLGVPPTVEKAKTEMRKSSNGEMTVPQKILSWYDNQPKGRVFKISEMLDESGINKNNFKNAKRTNTIIKGIFDKLKSIDSGVYQIAV